VTQAEFSGSYDTICFRILAYEFATDNPMEFDKTIRGKLRSTGLGAFVPERVAVIRALKNDRQIEIQRFDRSLYYLSAKGPCANSTDFDIDRIAEDFSGRYPSIATDDMRGIITFAIYLYYLR
jgi:hypothetical protein